MRGKVSIFDSRIMRRFHDVQKCRIGRFGNRASKGIRGSFIFLQEGKSKRVQTSSGYGSKKLGGGETCWREGGV